MNACPLGHDKREGPTCPLSGTTKASPNNEDTLDASNQIPQDILNTTFSEASLPPGISSERIQSSIPRTPSSATTTSTEDLLNYWKYPSPAMFWKAIEKKHSGAPVMRTLMTHPSDINAVVHLHNIVNERVWQEIKYWEKTLHANEYLSFHEKDNNGLELTSELASPSKTATTAILTFPFPTLTRFVGRPGDYSPKSLWNHYVLGYTLPFDRHDWYVNRNGTTVRYIVDFYAGSTVSTSNEKSFDAKEEETLCQQSSIGQNQRSRQFLEGIEPAASFYLDVRPEATLIGLFDRFKMSLYSKFRS